MADSTVPVFQEYMNPILSALRTLGGESTILDLDARVAKDMHLSEDVLAVPHGPVREDGQREVSYRMAWARTYLKKARLIDNPRRAVWALTAEGFRGGPVDEYALAAEIAKPQELRDRRTHTRRRGPPPSARKTPARDEGSPGSRRCCATTYCR